MERSSRSDRLGRRTSRLRRPPAFPVRNVGLGTRRGARPAADSSRSGAVLVAVLALAALVAAIAIEISYLARLEGDRASDARGRAAATLLAWSGTAMAQEILASDPDDVDALTDRWASPFTWNEDYGSVTVTIEDESARLPIRDLHDPEGRLNVGVKTRLERLLVALAIPSERIGAIIDWEDRDGERFPGGAEYGEYASLGLARRPPNRRLEALEELPLVLGLEDTAGRRLIDHVTLWGSAYVNLNTAAAPVLAALVPELGGGGADRIVARRDWARFENVRQAGDVVGLSQADLSALEKLASVRSSTFRVTARATAYGKEATLISIVERQPAGFTVKYRRLL